jgi:hypothetical protein
VIRSRCNRGIRNGQRSSIARQYSSSRIVDFSARAITSSCAGRGAGARRGKRPEVRHFSQELDEQAALGGVVHELRARVLERADHHTNDVAVAIDDRPAGVARLDRQFDLKHVVRVANSVEAADAATAHLQ